MDMNGRIVRHANATENNINIDISNITKGVYFIKVQTSTGVITRGLVIE